MDYVAELLSGDPGSVCEISLYRGKAQRLARFFGGWDLECVLPVRLQGFGLWYVLYACIA